MKEIEARGKIIGKSRPSVCIPIIAPDYKNMMAQIDEALAYSPDLLEVRIDLWNGEELKNINKYFNSIRTKIKQIPVIATYRTVNEGGKGLYKARQLFDLYTLLIEHKEIDIVDIEIFREGINISYLLENKNNKKIILSYHNFRNTPRSEELLQILIKGNTMGADIVKIAVMPVKPGDVLELLKAADESKKYIDIPVIAVSMGNLGKITRIFAGVFGSIMTFSSLKSMPSAPGQIDAEKIHRYLNDMYE